jgi:Ca2+-binding RTX toxin-like protein
MNRSSISLGIASLLLAGIAATIPVQASAVRPKCFGKTATIVGTNGQDELRGTPKGDVIVAKGGDDLVESRGGVDRICLGRGFDFAAAGPGDDRIAGGRAIDFMEGGPGDDLINGGRGVGDHTLYERTTHRIVANLKKQKVTGQGNDKLSSVDSVHSGSGNDLLIGTNEFNDLTAFEGNDVIRAFDGDDYTNGGAGDDTTAAGPGFDVIDFGFSNETSGVVASLVTGTSTGFGNDTFTGGEALVGTMFNDVLEGDDGPNDLIGFEGDDTLSALGDDDLIGAGGGNDTVDGGGGLDFYCPICDSDPPSGITVDIAAGTATDANGTDTLAGVESSGGTDGNDDLNGDGGTNALVSFAGDDAVDTGAGDDLADGGDGIDSVAGGPGLDYLGHLDHSTPVTVDLAAGTTEGDGTVPDSDTFSGFEDALGSFNDDVIRGDDGPNALRGEFGDDTIEGRGGDDILIGACALVEGHFFLEPPCEDDGNDTLDGGDGTDRCLEGETNTSCESLTSAVRSLARASGPLTTYARTALHDRTRLLGRLPRWAHVVR